MIHIVADLVAAALIIGFAVIGLVRGFVKTFFGLFGFLIAVILALFLTAPLAEFLSRCLVEPALTRFFLHRLTEETQQSTGQVDFSALPESALKLFSHFGFSGEKLNDLIAGMGQNVGEELTRAIAAKAVAGAASLISRVISFLLIFAGSSILIAVLTRVLDLVAKVPGLKFSNRLFGCAAGALEGLTLAFVFSVILASMAPVMQQSDNEFFRTFVVDQTFLVRFLSEWNPLAFTNP